MESLNQYVSQYTPHAIAAAVLLAFILFVWMLLRRRKQKKAAAPRTLSDALPKEHGIPYKIGRGIWICIAALFQGLFFLLKLIVPNMVLVERLLVLAGIGLIAYPLIFPPMNYYYIGAGIVSLIVAVVAHAYNDEMRRNAMDKKAY